jgi:hypothetical protein
LLNPQSNDVRELGESMGGVRKSNGSGEQAGSTFLPVFQSFLWSLTTGAQDLPTDGGHWLHYQYILTSDAQL